ASLFGTGPSTRISLRENPGPLPAFWGPSPKTSLGLRIRFGRLRWHMPDIPLPDGLAVTHRQTHARRYEEQGNDQIRRIANRSHNAEISQTLIVRCNERDETSAGGEGRRNHRRSLLFNREMDRISFGGVFKLPTVMQ